MNRHSTRSRSTATLICAIIALIWMLFCGGALKDAVSNVPTGNSSAAAGAQLGSMIALTMLTPFFIVGWLGTIFSWFAWLTNKSGLALAAAILYCVSLVLAPSYAFGLIPCIVLGYIGYAKIKKLKETT